LKQLAGDCYDFLGRQLDPTMFLDESTKLLNLFWCNTGTSNGWFI